MCYVTYEVYITGFPEERSVTLGMGSSAVQRFYQLAEAGIPGATLKKIECSLYVEATLLGSDLAAFLKKEYPETYQEIRGMIVPERSYTIICYDVS